MLRFVFCFSALILFFTAAQSARADSPGKNVQYGKVIGQGMIYLYANDEAKNSQLGNVLNAVRQLDGFRIHPGEVFSFNRAAHMLDQNIPYGLGPDVTNTLVPAGGVCMVSTMVATAAADAGLPFVNEQGFLVRRPVPHSHYYRYYHQVNRLGDRMIPVVEATVAIERDDISVPWHTIQDLHFVNTTGRMLTLHFEPSWSYADLDLSKPFDHNQRDLTLKVEMRIVPGGFDAWLEKLNRLIE